VTHSIALNMIVKNEAKHLGKALQSVADCVDEIVIVDTGSEDNTLQIAESFGAKVIEFDWIDDFAAARNCAIGNSTSDWILTLDADEYLLPEAQLKLKQLKQELTSPNFYYWFTRVFQKNNNAVTYQKKIYLFPNRPDIHWKFRVHEQINHDFALLDMQSRTIDLRIQLERSDETAETRQKKSLYYYQLLLEELERYPNESILLYHLGKECYMLKKYNEAIIYLQQAFDTLHENSALFSDLTYYLVSSLYSSGRMIEGWSALKHAQEVFPENISLLNLEASLMRVQKKPEKAAELYLEVIEICKSGDQTQDNIDTRQASASARLNLADIYMELSQTDKAKQMWSAVLKDFPENEWALKGLNQFLGT